MPAGRAICIVPGFSMNLETLQSNWAAWLALGAVVVGIIAIAPKLIARSSRSKLNRVVADMKKARKELRKTNRKAARAARKLGKLETRADRVKPRVLQEAKNALDDAKALQKILGDKVLVTENHVRRVIHDEFPPSDHERLRSRYLPQDVRDKRPFSF